MNSEDDDEFQDFESTTSVEFLEKNVKKAHQVDYIVWDYSDLKAKQELEIAQLSPVLGLSHKDAATLLHYFYWDREKLFEKFYLNSCSVLKLAGITKTVNRVILLAHQIRPNFMCEICFDQDPQMETVGISCEHRFCRHCYTFYLIQKIKEETSCRNIQCPQNKCNIMISQSIIELLVPPEIYQTYCNLLNSNFVTECSSLKWCPAPHCQHVIECHAQSIFTAPTVECTCLFRFCFGCGLEGDHQPCTCTLVKMWLQKCKDDLESAYWITANTKNCPKCHSAIEKNGGCNHMTCRQCRYHFCWVCMGSWFNHNTDAYRCNRFDEKNHQKATSRASLERYLHYYHRFVNHEKSAKLDEKLYKQTEKKMQELVTNSDLSWIEVQFLKTAVDILVQCRITLKWAYAFAYFLNKTNESEIYEDNQCDLELATEQLSELLEMEYQTLVKSRQAVLDKMSYVKLRREILLEETAIGLQEDSWSFISQ